MSNRQEKQAEIWPFAAKNRYRLALETGTVSCKIVDHFEGREVISQPHDGVGTSKLFYRKCLITTHPVKYFRSTNSIVRLRNNFYSGHFFTNHKSQVKLTNMNQ